MFISIKLPLYLQHHETSAELQQSGAALLMALASQGRILIFCPFEYFFLYQSIATSFLNLQLDRKQQNLQITFYRT